MRRAVLFAAAIATIIIDATLFRLVCYRFPGDGMTALEGLLHCAEVRRLGSVAVKYRGDIGMSSVICGLAQNIGALAVHAAEMAMPGLKLIETCSHAAQRARKAVILFL